MIRKVQINLQQQETTKGNIYSKC